MEWGVTKLNEIVPNKEKLVPQTQAKLLNAMIQIYNTFLHFLVNIVTHPDLFEIAFPAVESATTTVNWNSVESFRFLRQACQDSLLPSLPIPYSTFASFHEIVNLYLVFIDMLSSLPYANHSDLERLKIQIPEFLSIF
jgi:hypothetical protein